MRALWAIALVLLSGCQAYRAPRGHYAAEALAQEYMFPGPALVAYLSQQDADPGVCDLYRQGPTVTLVDERSIDRVHTAFEQGRIDDRVYQQCVVHLWDATSEPVWEHLIDSLMSRIERTAPSADSDVGAFRLAVWRRIISSHSGTRPVPIDQVKGLASSLRDTASDPGMGSGARSLLVRLIEDVEVEAGLYKGRPVTADDIASLDDETRLLAWARRLPAELRPPAQDRLVSLRIERAPFALVRKSPGAVRAALAQHGHFPLPADRRVESLSFEARGGDPTVVNILQDPRLGSAGLVLTRRDGSQPDEPGLDLRYTLWAQVSGLEEPITVCPGADPWDPTPCLPTDRLELEHPLAALSSSRVLFRKDATMKEVLDIAKGGERFAIPLVAQGKSVDLSFSFVLQPVAPLRWSGPTPAGRGPDIAIDAWQVDNGRLVIAAKTAGSATDYTVLLDPTDPDFRIASVGGRGAEGQRGRDGADGIAGADGYNAVCPSTEGTDGQKGGDGEDGTDGGPGGPGGDGGNVQVRLRCTDCASARAELERRIFSLGGSGGSGGWGGDGGEAGKGGDGGDSARCEYYDDFFEENRTRTVNGGSNGWQGTRGSNGHRGPDGPDGNPGVVNVRVVGSR